MLSGSSRIQAVVGFTDCGAKEHLLNVEDERDFDDDHPGAH